MKNWILLALISCLVVLDGLVCFLYWKWFIVPLGMREITIMHAAGISALIGWTTFQTPKDPPEEAVIVIENVKRNIIAIIIGFILHFAI